MKRNQFIQTVFIASVALCSWGCKSTAQDPTTNHDTAGPDKPSVKGNSKNILLSWFEENTPKTALSPADVPEEHRASVRVQDLELPPERRDTRWVFLTDLTKPDANGQYPVKALLRDDWERQRRKSEPVSAQTGGAAPNIAPSPDGAPVIMYATKHCPACKSARRWLLKSKIPYIEKDLETDPGAAAAVAKKGQAQGVPTSGVPIFEIGGKLLPGFDPDAITRLLRGTKANGNTRNI